MGTSHGREGDHGETGSGCASQQRKLCLLNSMRVSREFQNKYGENNCCGACNERVVGGGGGKGE